MRRELRGLRDAGRTAVDRVVGAARDEGEAPDEQEHGVGLAQAEDGAELEQIRSQLAQADVAIQDQKNATCCYAKSDKYWTIDPQGIAWESFHTLDSIPMYGQVTRPRAELKNASAAACCGPTMAK